MGATPAPAQAGSTHSHSCAANIIRESEGFAGRVNYGSSLMDLFISPQSKSGCRNHFCVAPAPCVDLPTSWTSLDTWQWPPATRPHHRANLATRMLTAHPSPMPPARPCHRFARRPACLSCTAHRCHRLLQLRRQVHAPQAGWRARRRRPLVGATITSPMDQ